jgi:hypothetical protein
VADIPPPSVTSCRARAAWSLAADPSVTGSSLMAANVAMGKGASGAVAAVDGETTASDAG